VVQNGRQVGRVILGKDGVVRFIYKDEFAALLPQGKSTVARASHVEHCAGGWQADMSPVGGPMLGPFRLRHVALREEVKWLEGKGVPIPDGILQ